MLEHVQLEGKDYLEAVELLIESDAMQAYLVENEKPTVTVASAKADELLTGLESSIVATHVHKSIEFPYRYYTQESNNCQLIQNNSSQFCKLYMAGKTVIPYRNPPEFLWEPV